MHFKLLARGKTKPLPYGMLRMQAFVPKGVKSSRATFLPKAASPSPPRVCGHIAKQHCAELTNAPTGKTEWHKTFLLHYPWAETIGHLQTCTNWLPVVWGTHGKNHQSINRYSSRITNTLRTAVSLQTTLPAHTVFCQPTTQIPASQLLLILGQKGRALHLL